MWLSDIILEMVQHWLNSFLDSVLGSVNEYFNQANNVVNLSEVNTISSLINIFSTSIIVAVMMKQILSTYVLETDGDSDQSPIKVLEKGCIALALIHMNNYILRILLNMANTLCDALLGSININFLNEELGRKLEEGFGFDSLLWIVLLLAYTVGFVMFLWKSLKRNAELAAMKMVFGIFACDIVTVGMERFRSFISSYIVTIFSFVLQMIFFKLSILMMVGRGNFMLALAFIFMAATAPKWLEKYVYSSGIAKSTANTARTAGYMLPQLLRMVK